jgi:hypothetical protein
MVSSFVGIVFVLIEGGFPRCLHGGAGRGRNSKSRIAVQATAEGGDHFVVVLEFEFLSRIIASMQSMTYCRCARRRIG